MSPPDGAGARAGDGIRLAHVSDLHVDLSPERTERVRAVVAGLATLDVDGVVVTGDLADHASPDEYALAGELLGELSTPVVVCAGNHDDPAQVAALQERLSGPGVGVGWHRVFVLGGATVLALDSTIPGADGGTLLTATARAHTAAATVSGRPVVVALHHPPCDDATGLPTLDEPGRRVLDEVVWQADARCVLAGHLHDASVRVFAGVPLVVAPSVAPRIVQPWETAPADDDVVSAVVVHVADEVAVTVRSWRVTDAIGD